MKTHTPGIIRKLGAAVVLVVCMGATTIAQQSPRRDASAIDLLDQVFTVKTSAIASIHDTVALGQVQLSDGTIGTLRITTQGSSNIRYDTALSGRNSTSVTSNGSGYQLVGNQKKALPPWMTTYQTLDHLPMLSRISDYRSANATVADLGLQTFAGQSGEDIRISVQPPGSKTPQIEDRISELHIFLDPMTYAIVGIRDFIYSPNAIENRSPVDFVFSNYQLVNDIPVPFRVDEYVSGKLDRVIIWSSVQFNTGVPLSLFN